MRISRDIWNLIGVNFGVWCVFAARPNPWVQFAAMGMSLVALVTIMLLIIQGVVKWREHGWVNLVSCLLIVASFSLAALSGNAVRKAVFQHNLDRWNRAAVWVMTHHEANEDMPIKLPPPYSRIAYVVWYRYDKPCGLMIDFVWGSGFPVKHTVRRYATDPAWIDKAQCHKDWSRGRVLSGNWYEISD